MRSSPHLAELQLLGIVFVRQNGKRHGRNDYGLGNYQMAVERCMREGTAVCWMEGKLRYPDGSIEEGRWQIVGTESGTENLCIFDTKKNKVLHIPKQAAFLKVVLKKTDKSWHTMRLTASSIIQT